jgi:hypothetical protein
VLGGMDAGTPVAQLAPDTPEQLFNIDMDPNGRAIGRPGSTFFSRIGEGNILGLHEHTFEFGGEPRRPVGIVRDAYATVTTLRDSTMDPAVAYDTGFAPDFSVHDDPLWQINAKATDRFHFASFLNDLYFAGSTVLHTLWQYSYSTQLLKEIPIVRGTAVVATGDRLWVGGDPQQPNVMFPSDPVDPEVFNPDLGIQIGTRNDRILALLEDDGLILVLTNRSAHWLVAGAVELGDVQTEPVSQNLGVAGPLGATKGSDGWFYWLDPVDGPCRWRRGMEAPDLLFAKKVLELFRNSRGDDLSGTVVENDPVNHCIRFQFATGPGQTPDYMLSYFQRGDQWTHGASTTERWRVSRLPEFTRPQDEDLGATLYTDMIHRLDILDGQEKLYGGCDSGIIWVWNRFCLDKYRSTRANEAGVEFLCVLRFGPMEIAPVMYRGLIQELMFDALLSYQFSFDLHAELDYKDQFNLVGVCSRDVDGGEFGDLELDTTIYSNRLHPTHIRLPMWSLGLGKIVRLETSWSCLRVVGFAGVEFERALQPPSAVKIQSPPVPFGVIVWNGLLDPPGGGGGGGESDGPPVPPHEPPTGGGDPIPVEIVVGGAGGDPSVNDRRHNPMDVRVPLAPTTYTITPPDYTNSPQRANYGVFTQDENTLITTFYEQGYFLNFLDYSTKTAPVLDLEEDVDALQHNDGKSSIMNCDGMWLDATPGAERLFVGFWGFGGSWSGSYLLCCWNIAHLGAGATTQIAKLETSAFSFASRLTMKPDMGTGFVCGRAGAGPNQAVHSFSFSGAAFAPLDSLVPTGSPTAPGSVTTMSLAYNAERDIVVCVGNSSTHTGYMSILDVSSPAAMTESFSYTAAWAAGANPQKPHSVAINRAGTRAYVWSQHRNGVGTDSMLHIFDITGAPSILKAIEWTVSSSSGFNPHGNLMVLDPTEDYLYVGDPERFFVMDLRNDPVFSATEDAVAAWGNFGNINHLGAPWNDSQGQDLGEPLGGAAGLAALGAAGVLGIISLSLDEIDYSSPEIVSAWFDDRIRFSPAVQWDNEGDHVFAIGHGGNTLLVWALDGDARSLRLAAELNSSDFNGARGLQRKGNVLNVVNGSGSVINVDITDPENPSVLTTTPVIRPGLAGSPTQPRLRGQLTDSLLVDDYGLSLFDDTTNGWLGSVNDPRLRGLKHVERNATHLFWIGNTDNANRLVITDQTLQHAVVGFLDLPSVGQVAKIVLDTSELYVLQTSNNGLDPIITVVDVSTPAAPAIIGTYSASNMAGALGMAIDGNDLFVVGANTAANIIHLDITAPAAITQTAFKDTGTQLHDVVVIAGTNLVVVQSDGLLESYDIATLTQQDTLATGGATVSGLSVDGTNVIVVMNGVVGTSARVHVVDASTITAMTLTGTTPTDATGLLSSGPVNFDHNTVDDIVVVGDAPGAATSSEVGIVDISTPATPTVVDQMQTSTFDSLRRTYAFAWQDVGNQLFIGHDNGWNGISQYDISTPAAPSLLADMDPRHCGWQAHGPNLFMAASEDKQVILSWHGGSAEEVACWINFQNVFAPRDLNRDEIAASGTDVAAMALNQDGTTAFVVRKPSGGVWGVYMYDVSAPGTATAQGNFAIGTKATAIKVSGGTDRVVVISGESPGTMWVIDFTVPAAPVLDAELSPLSLNTITDLDLELY